MRKVMLVALLLPLLLSACGDTWRGVRKDTGDNLEATGHAVEKTGEHAKP